MKLHEVQGSTINLTMPEEVQYDFDDWVSARIVDTVDKIPAGSHRKFNVFTDPSEDYRAMSAGNINDYINNPEFAIWVSPKGEYFIEDLLNISDSGISKIQASELELRRWIKLCKPFSPDARFFAPQQD